MVFLVITIWNLFGTSKYKELLWCSSLSFISLRKLWYMLVLPWVTLYSQKHGLSIRPMVCVNFPIPRHGPRSLIVSMLHETFRACAGNGRNSGIDTSCSHITLINLSCMFGPGKSGFSECSKCIKFHIFLGLMFSDVLVCTTYYLVFIRSKAYEVGSQWSSNWRLPFQTDAP